MESDKSCIKENKKQGDISSWLNSLADEISQTYSLLSTLERLNIKLGYDPKPEEVAMATKEKESEPSVVEKLRILNARLCNLNERLGSAVNIMDNLI